MARGRFVSTSIALDPALNRASVPAQLLYLRCIPHLDRDGLIIGRPAALWARVAPLMDDLLPTMPGLIDELATLGLVLRFETAIGPVLWFKGFNKNQQGMRYDREGPSEYEPPPGYVRTSAGLAPPSKPDNGKPSPDELRTNSGLTPPQVEVEVEVKGEVKGEVEGQAADKTPDESHALKQTQLASGLAEKLAQVGVGLSPFIVDEYLALTSEYGLQAVLAGINAAADNNKQHSFSYVRACARNKAQGKRTNGKPPADEPYSGKWDNYQPRPDEPITVDDITF